MPSNKVDEIQKLKSEINAIKRNYHMLFKYVKQNMGAISVIKERLDKLEKEKQ